MLTLIIFTDGFRGAEIKRQQQLYLGVLLRNSQRKNRLSTSSLLHEEWVRIVRRTRLKAVVIVDNLSGYGTKIRYHNLAFFQSRENTLITPWLK